MGITRARLAIDEHFTAVPNEWARDARLSRRARGLLVEVMSHRVGWHVTIRSLAAVGKEGRDAIQSALNELVTHGYVVRSQSRSAGKFGEIEYELCDPPTVSGFSGRGEQSPGQTASGFTVSGFAVSGESATKKNISSEEHLSEGLLAPGDVDQPMAATFAEFYMAYPRKVGKEAARRAFERVARTVDPALVVDGARRYAADPNLPEKQFIPHPASWLNAGRWDDEPEARRTGATPAGPSTDDFAEGDEWMAFNR
ncbi:hypothetical protein ACFVR6_03820 [Microbacterium sp. NPDC058021]|uniref:helix-turn-helix domain-containing protein n=1 Tax=Microbacterium sp. NPDC058021 TaxID=3346306 RepID=UPI0036D96497